MARVPLHAQVPLARLWGLRCVEVTEEALGARTCACRNAPPGCRRHLNRVPTQSWPAALDKELSSHRVSLARLTRSKIKIEKKSEEGAVGRGDGGGVRSEASTAGGGTFVE